MDAVDPGLGRIEAEPFRMTSPEFDDLITVVKKNVAGWCRLHDEFPGVAGWVIAEAEATHNPALGTLDARVAIRARNRVARTLYRRHRSTPGTGSPTSKNDAALSVPDPRDPFIEVESRLDLLRFLDRLRGRERTVAALLADGHTQAEAARITGIHPRTVSQIVASIRPQAELFFVRRRPPPERLPPRPQGFAARGRRER